MTRALDFTLAAAGLLAAAPLLLAIALLIKLGDGGSVFFRQQRIGRYGRPFWIWKFRTMVENAERLGRPLTVGDDPRITRIGRWLRRSKLDELPQLLNVLCGEMSLVGPRPEAPCYVDLYDSNQRRVLDYRPGVTDPASIRYRNESELLATAADPERAYVEQIMPDKIRINLQYAQRRTVLTDAVVILQTVAAVLGVSPRKSAGHGA